MVQNNGSLKPLTLKDVSLELNLHESTISRVTNGKYMQTSKGILELKVFFSSILGKKTSTQASGSSAKQTIGRLIFNENKNKPLSDNSLAKELKHHSIIIARRTVCKYRE